MIFLTGQAENKKGKAKTTKNTKKPVTTHWKASMPCRAVYEGDGQEYEAVVLRIINENECIVRFLGKTDVYISVLVPATNK
jgi:hypothetical protein